MPFRTFVGQSCRVYTVQNTAVISSSTMKFVYVNVCKYMLPSVLHLAFTENRAFPCSRTLQHRWQEHGDSDFACIQSSDAEMYHMVPVGGGGVAVVEVV